MRRLTASQRREGPTPTAKVEIAPGEFLSVGHLDGCLPAYPLAGVGLVVGLRVDGAWIFTRATDVFLQAFPLTNTRVVVTWRNQGGRRFLIELSPHPVPDDPDATAQNYW
jgi:hypothetical protein